MGTPSVRLYLATFTVISMNDGRRPLGPDYDHRIFPEARIVAAKHKKAMPRSKNRVAPGPFRARPRAAAWHGWGDV